MPYRTALAQGATHITRTTLRRETPALRATFLSREARLADDDRRLAAYQAQSPADATPAVFSIRPAPHSPEVSRLATNGPLLRAAFEAGRAAAAHRPGVSGVPACRPMIPKT